MSRIETLKTFIKDFIEICPHIRPENKNDSEVNFVKYLSGYITNNSAPIGIQFHLKNQVNIWTSQDSVRLENLDKIDVTEKLFLPGSVTASNSNSPWCDPPGSKPPDQITGALSSLRSWRMFYGKDLYMFEVVNIADATRLFGELLRK